MSRLTAEQHAINAADKHILSLMKSIEKLQMRLAHAKAYRESIAPKGAAEFFEQLDEARQASR